jgi:restriction system protein
MARRGKSSPAEDVIAIASKLPWWVALILAVVGYLALHFYANQPFATSMVPGKAIDFVLPAMIKGVATVGQYVLPMLLVISAGLSWYKSRSAETTQKLASQLGRKAGPVSNVESPLCPLCSSSMQRRQAKRGANAGNFFWGCSGYPRCKGIRTAD